MAKKKEPIEILEDAAPKYQQNIEANLSTGSSMLDLAISGKIGKAFGPGHYTLYVGDSGSGKTFLLLTAFAEAAKMSFYDDYKFIYICSENGNNFDMQRFFGSKVAKRVETVKPESLEAMYDYLDKLGDAGTKYIAVVDSGDGFATEAEIKHIKENSKLREKGKDTKGTYGMTKARTHSDRLKHVIHHIEKTGSILAIIAQTRDNVEAGLFEDAKTRSGGHALKFYAHSEVWLSVGESIKRKANDRDREIGKFANCKVKKNRVNGKARQVRVAILPEFGIDDIGTVFDWLIMEKFLTASGGRYPSPWYDKTYYLEELIQKIQEDGREAEVLAYTQECWDKIESELQVFRKPRYE